jgi:hypothetical protein
MKSIRACATPMNDDATMTALLRELLERLEEIGEDHSEIYDSGVRDRMGAAIWEGFVAPQPGFAVPAEFGMFSAEGDQLVYKAISEYVEKANRRADELSMNAQDERLRAFEQHGIDTTKGEQFDDFFWNA